MNKFYLPEGYKPVLNLYQTQSAIGILKTVFAKNLCDQLNLKRVSAPLFVDPATGLNDDLSGRERPVTFDIPGASMDAAVVQSLAKWKRLALHRYGFSPGEGLYADMNAIRRDDDLDNTHSVYVDQWDWEKVILGEERNIPFLKETVGKIMSAITDTLSSLKALFPEIKLELKNNVTFITASELYDMYPRHTSEQREYFFTKEHKTVFITQIGCPLPDGLPHSSRAPDYDDWNLNGDLIVWDEILGAPLELSSMGIRVDAVSMKNQLKAASAEERSGLLFHDKVLKNLLPPTIGGGIGQSRLSMLLLEKAHIGEVQSSVWDKETLTQAEKHGVVIL